MIDEIYEYASRFYRENNLAHDAISAIELRDFDLCSEREMIITLSKFLDDVLEESEEVDKMRQWVNRKYFELV